MNTQAGRAGQDQTNVGIRVPRPLYQRFREVAQANHRSVSAEVRFVIERHVEEHDAAVALKDAA